MLKIGLDNITDLLKLAIPECLAIAEELWASVAAERERASSSEAELELKSSGFCCRIA